MSRSQAAAGIPRGAMKELFARVLPACALCAVLQPAMAAEPRKPATPDEINSGLGLSSPGMAVSPDGRWVMFGTNKGPGIINLETGKAFNADDRQAENYWLLVEHMSLMNWSPDGKTAAFSSWKDMKYHLLFWSPKGDDAIGEPRKMLSVQQRMFINPDAAWSPDGKTYYVVISHQMPWKKSDAGDDNDPGEGVNVTVKPTPPYGELTRMGDIHYKRNYPEAYAELQRSLILAIDAASGKTGLVALGNDIRALSLSPDGRRLLALQPKQSLPEKETAWTGQVLTDIYLIDLPKEGQWPAVDLDSFNDRTAGWSDASGKRLHPLMVDVHMNTTEAFDPLIGVEGNNGNPLVTWAPDSSRFAYATTGRQATGDVYIFDLAAKKSRNLTESAQIPASAKTLGYAEYAYKYVTLKFGNWYPPLWMADGKTLLSLGRGELWRISADGAGAPEKISGDIPLEIRRMIPTREGNTPLLDKDGLLTVVARERMSRLDSVWKLDPKSGRAQKLLDTGLSVDMYAETDEAGSRLLLTGQTNVSAKNLYRLDLKTGATLQRLTKYREQLAEREYPQTKVLEVRTPTGGNGFALLYLPANASASHKVPMVLDGYPGTRYSQLETRSLAGASSYPDSVYSLLQEGIAVLLPDLPLSAEGVYQKPMQQTIDAVIAAANAAVDTGFIDKAHLGIMGTSYGGYMAQAVITQTNMFKAAMSMAGTGDLFGEYAGAAIYGPRWFEIGQGRLGAPLWAEPQRYVDNSPITYFDKVQTPILIMHGEEDFIVPVEASAKSFRGLRHAKHTVLFAKYRRLGHQENGETRLRVRLWFREHLLGGEPLTQYGNQNSFFLGGMRPGDKLAAPAKAPPAEKQ